MADEADSADRELPPPPTPVIYCGVCSLPPDMCEYDSGKLDKCKTWLAANHPDLFRSIYGAEPPSQEEASAKMKEITDAAAAAPIVKKLAGGKVRKEDPSVIVKRVERSKRKCVTVVSGLETVGVKLSDAASIFKKKFSCGASVVKGPLGGDEIDIQGDIVDEVIDLLASHFKISDNALFTMEGQTKVPARE